MTLLIGSQSNMPVQVDETTLVPVGVVAGAGLVVWRSVVWILGIKNLVDSHTTQINTLEENVERGNDSRAALHEKTNGIVERVVRMETKIDLLVDKLTQ